MTATHRGSGTPPCSRLLHPGPPNPLRVVEVPTLVTPRELVLPAGAPLLAAIEDLLDTTGDLSFNGELVGGELQQFDYFIPDVGPVGGPVADFSARHRGRGPARLQRGGITVGRRDGAVFTHCHALFTDARGEQRAGHLIPDSVVLGEAVRARLWGSADVALESLPDSETLMTLFVPRDARRTGRGTTPAVICRLAPNVDLVRTIEDVVERTGWETAHVRGQIGSLVGAELEQPDGSVVVVDGPATEVMTIDGPIGRSGSGVIARLEATVLDRHGVHHSGRLLPGRNAVAMTFELALTAT